MRKKFYRILLLSAVMSLYLTLGESVTFAQCGADGTQPCNTTPKKTTPKKTTVKPSQTVSKTNKTQPSKTKNITNPLRSKLIGNWLISNLDENVGEFWKFFANGNANSGYEKFVCQNFKFVLNKDILRLTDVGGKQVENAMTLFMIKK